jgi:hypothetical protein
MYLAGGPYLYVEYGPPARYVVRIVVKERFAILNANDTACSCLFANSKLLA